MGIRRKEESNINRKQEMEPWQHTGRRETVLGGKDAAVQKCTSWRPLERRNPTKQCVVVIKRRRDRYVRNGRSPSSRVQNREDSGAGLKTAKYGRLYVPHGKSENLQRVPLRRPPPMMKNPAFLLPVTNC